MRTLMCVGFVAFLASSGSAMAADCTKGLLWPYVRNPGDCLTDDEIKSGRLGSFSGAATVAAPNAAAPSIAQQPPAQATTPAAIAPTAQTSPSQPAHPVQAVATPATCEKGWLWPFVRDSGDCPTAAERKAGGSTAAARPGSQQGNLVSAIFRSGSDSQSATANLPVATDPVSANAPAAGCTKGVLWPFVRDNGDCPTAAEKGKASSPATQAKLQPASAPTPSAPAATPAVVATPAPLAAVPVASTPAAGCTKSLLWPFVREDGDCPTAAEKGKALRPADQAKVEAIAATSTQTAVAPLTATTVVPPTSTPAATNAPAADIASCHKGLFWPFVREAGDCPTDADKGKGSGKP